ncbi:MAG: MFS transporter, partial [Chloroflexi bacterium]|nr:MFS transporter [Chloroflexota bacterium]
MNHPLRWKDHILINIYWLGLNVASGTITPVLLPYLVALFVPPEQKNTYLGLVRVIGLAVAMLIQPIAGMFSDRNTSRWGRRRPFIFTGTMLDLVFLAIIGASPLFIGSALDGFFLPTLGITTALFVLIAGIVLLQMASNLAHGALQGLIPDLVPEDQRGRSSGVKAVMELLPVFLVIVVGPLVDRGQIWPVVGFVGLALTATMLATVLGVREEPLREKPTEPVGERVWRLVALTAIFVLVTRGALWLVNAAGAATAGAALGSRVAVGVLVGLIAMAGSIFLGVYFGAWVGIGREAPRQTSFIWWVVNRLMFLAAVGSVQGFAQYFLRDVLHIPNAATMTTILLAVVAVFLLPAALGGGYLADRVGRKRLVALSGLVAGAGTVLLLFSQNIPMVLISGCIIGLGTGIFYASNWALGTDLAPSAEAVSYT